MKLRAYALAVALVALPIFAAAPANADAGASSFVEKEHQKLIGFLKQPPSAARDAQVTGELDTMVDYNLLAQRTFGNPCAKSLPNCTNHWASLGDSQKAEVTDLLKKLVQKNYKKNLTKTLDYELTFKSTTESNGETRVRTQAQSKVQAREAPTTVDYIVVGEGGSYHIVDIVTEGSSLTKNYYTQFNKMLTTPEQGYPHVVKKLREKL
jgi:phospholipid transport system substrate-binding protein